jgi:hypothetical protein
MARVDRVSVATLGDLPAVLTNLLTGRLDTAGMAWIEPTDHACNRPV